MNTKNIRFQVVLLFIMIKKPKRTEFLIPERIRQSGLKNPKNPNQKAPRSITEKKV
jgi:hypothetical protein